MGTPSCFYFDALRASRELHARSKKFNGRFLIRYLAGLEPLIRLLDCRTLLDYGCGKGVQWDRLRVDGLPLAEHLGVEVTRYDPAWPAFADEPRGQFDIVVCTQVLGSIPIPDLSWVADRLLGLAAKAVFVGERIKPPRKVTFDSMKDQMPHGWSHDQWLALLRSRDAGKVKTMLQTLDSGDFGRATFSLIASDRLVRLGPLDLTGALHQTRGPDHAH